MPFPDDQDAIPRDWSWRGFELSLSRSGNLRDAGKTSLTSYSCMVVMVTFGRLLLLLLLLLYCYVFVEVSSLRRENELK